MASRVAVLLLLGLICVGFASGEIPADCCLSKSNKHLPLKVIQSYTVQKAGEGCEISATAFITKRGRKLCLSHPEEEEWVRGHIKALDDKKAKQ